VTGGGVASAPYVIFSDASYLTVDPSGNWGFFTPTGTELFFVSRTQAVGNCVPGIYAENDLYGQTGNVASICTLTPAVEGLFRVSVAINVTFASTGSIIECTYTDHNSTAQTDKIPIAPTGTGTFTAGAFTTVDRWSGEIMIRAKSTTAVVVKTISYATGTYDVSAVIERLAGT